MQRLAVGPAAARMMRRPMCPIGRIAVSRRALVVEAVRAGRGVRRPRPAGPPASRAAAPSAAETTFYTSEEALSAEVLAPGAVDAGMFEADASAQALLAELEQVSAQLGDVLDAPPAAGQLDLASDAGGGDMLRGEHGMFSTTVSARPAPQSAPCRGRCGAPAWIRPRVCRDAFGALRGVAAPMGCAAASGARLRGRAAPQPLRRAACVALAPSARSAACLQRRSLPLPACAGLQCSTHSA